MKTSSTPRSPIFVRLLGEASDEIIPIFAVLVSRQADFSLTENQRIGNTRRRSRGLLRITQVFVSHAQRFEMQVSRKLNSSA